MPASDKNLRQTVDKEEISRFDTMADDWWDPDGPSAMLLKLNPLRLSFILDSLAPVIGNPAGGGHALGGIQLLDVGCGGGILSEPMARLGAKVTGIDASEANISVARDHAQQMNLKINYQNQALEELHNTGQKFEVVTAMEVLEHVADKAIFLETLSLVLKPGGSLFLSTFNKTLKSYAAAIVGAEYLFRLLPRGTHQWEKFTPPSKIIQSLLTHGLEPLQIRGVGYAPFASTWTLTRDLSVSYILHASKPLDQS